MIDLPFVPFTDNYVSFSKKPLTHISFSTAGLVFEDIFFCCRYSGCVRWNFNVITIECMFL